MTLLCSIAIQTPEAPQLEVVRPPAPPSKQIATRDLIATPIPLELEEDGRFPTLAADPQGKVYLTWYGRGTQKGETKLQQKVWTGEAWSQTQTVAAGGGWMVNWADFAKFSIDESGSAMVTWLAGAHGHGGYGVMYQKRREAGAGWTEPRALHQDKDAVEHGFVSLLPLDDGNFFATWIQSTAKGPPTDLRFATYSPTGVPHEEQVLDTRICDCCATAAVRLDNGEVLIAYRNRSEAEVRNIQMLRGLPEAGSEWTSPKFEEPQDWMTASCPVNGPVLTAQGQFVLLAYYHQGPKGQGQVKYSWSNDGGVSFTYPSILQRKDPILGRVGLAMLNEQTAVLSWLERSGKTSRWMACTLDTDGKAGDSIVLGEVKGGRADGFLQLASAQNSVLAAWTASNGKSLKVSEIKEMDKK